MLHSNHSGVEKLLFDPICQLTEKRDKNTLTNLIAKGANINTMQGDYSPVGFFAKKNDKDSVDFLLDHFDANLKDAVLCAAWGNHHALILHLLSKEQDIAKSHELHHAIIRGMIRHSYPNHFKTLSGNIDRLCNQNPALRQDILNHTRDPSNRNSMLEELVYIHSQVHWYKTLNYTQATDWYNKCKPSIEEELASASPPAPGFSKNFLSKTRRLRALINKNAYDKSVTFFGNAPCLTKLSYEQAQIWFKPELHIWFLIGLEKCRDRTFPIDIFLLISSYIFDVSFYDANDLLKRHIHVVPKMLYDMAMKEAITKLNSSGNIGDKINQVTSHLPFSPTLFTTTPERKVAQNKFDEEKNEITRRYQRRTS